MSDAIWFLHNFFFTTWDERNGPIRQSTLWFSCASAAVQISTTKSVTICWAGPARECDIHAAKTGSIWCSWRFEACAEKGTSDQTEEKKETKEQQPSDFDKVCFRICVLCVVLFAINKKIHPGVKLQELSSQREKNFNVVGAQKYCHRNRVWKDMWMPTQKHTNGNATDEDATNDFRQRPGWNIIWLDTMEFDHSHVRFVTNLFDGRVHWRNIWGFILARNPLSVSLGIVKCGLGSDRNSTSIYWKYMMSDSSHIQWWRDGCEERHLQFEWMFFFGFSLFSWLNTLHVGLEMCLTLGLRFCVSDFVLFYFIFFIRFCDKFGELHQIINRTYTPAWPVRKLFSNKRNYGALCVPKKIQRDPNTSDVSTRISLDFTYRYGKDSKRFGLVYIT